MDKNRTNYIGYIVILWCIMVSLTYLILGGAHDMDIAQWITLAVALIGVAGGIWMEFRQLKRDSKSIDSIKADTDSLVKDVKPAVADTQEHAKKITSDVIPKIDSLTEMKTIITELGKETAIQKEIRNKAGKELDLSKIIGQITASFEKTSTLTDQVTHLNQKVIMLEQEKQRLNTQIFDLTNQLQETQLQNVSLQQVNKSLAEQLPHSTKTPINKKSLSRDDLSI